MTSPVPIAVIDTNVVLDLFVFDDPCARSLRAALFDRSLRWLVCATMREELRDVLHRKRLARWNPDSERVLHMFDAWSEPCPEPPPCAGAARPALRCRDTDDQVFVDLAVAHDATWLLTRDRALLALARAAAKASSGLMIMSPKRWSAAVVLRTAARSDALAGAGSRGTTPAT